MPNLLKEVNNCVRHDSRPSSKAVDAGDIADCDGVAEEFSATEEPIHQQIARRETKLGHAGDASLISDRLRSLSTTSSSTLLHDGSILTHRPRRNLRFLPHDKALCPMKAGRRNTQKEPLAPIPQEENVGKIHRIPVSQIQGPMLAPSLRRRVVPGTTASPLRQQCAPLYISSPPSRSPQHRTPSTADRIPSSGPYKGFVIATATATSVGIGIGSSSSNRGTVGTSGYVSKPASGCSSDSKRSGRKVGMSEVQRLHNRSQATPMPGQHAADVEEVNNSHNSSGSVQQVSRCASPFKATKPGSRLQSSAEGTDLIATAPRRGQPSPSVDPPSRSGLVSRSSSKPSMPPVMHIH